MQVKSNHNHSSSSSRTPYHLPAQNENTPYDQLYNNSSYGKKTPTNNFTNTHNSSLSQNRQVLSETSSNVNRGRPLLTHENLDSKDSHLKDFHPKMTQQHIMSSSSSRQNRVSPNLRAISPEKLIKKLEKDNSDVHHMGVEEINRELDNNMNQIIMMMNRRKILIQEKKIKIRKQFMQNIDSIRNQSKQNLYNQLTKENIQDSSLQELLNSAIECSKMPLSLSSELFNEQKSSYLQKNELKNSQDFWNQNKNYESDVDSQLKRLKYYDQELEKSNGEVLSVCSKLDNVEENIKDLLLQKSDQHLQKAEPFFQQKQLFHDQLKNYVSTRNKLKDEKISLIYSIISALQNLKGLRESRLSDLMKVFGIDQSQEKPEAQSKISQYINLVDQLENIAKVREQSVNLEGDEDSILKDMDRINRENELILQDLVRKQSEEAKIYSDYNDNLENRLLNQKVIEFFMMSSNLTGIAHMDIQDILKKFNDNIIFLKPLVEEDQAIRQGLQKTTETITTFSSILKSSENEKERTQELISILEECHKLKDIEEQKVDELRNQDIDVTKKIKQKNNLEEDLESILTDADLEQYKKLGNIIKQHETDINYLQKQKQKTQEYIDQIQAEVLQKMNLIKNEYDDVIREFIPNNLMSTYDFQRVRDIKNVKNQLKKAVKRLLGDSIQNSQIESYM